MDINSTFQNFINKEDDNNQASALDNIIRNIFLSCDEENTGNVVISRVINFVEPFLQENTDALGELRACLSENDDNSPIDMETFHKNMKKWIEKLSNTDSMKSTEIQNLSPAMDTEKNIGCAQYVHDFPKDYTEISILNLSDYSVDSQELRLSERFVLENHIQELQRQKSQLNDELVRLRLELDNCQEQNEALQGNLDKLLKKLANEQKFNESFQLERRKYDELQDQLSCSNKRIVKLEKTISTLEKSNNELKQHMDLLQTQKRELENKIRTMNKRVEEMNVDKTLLQTEIDLKKQELASQHEVNVALLKQNGELQDIIEECNINIEKLKLEKENLEKLFREQAEKTESLIALNKSYNSLNSSVHSNESDQKYEPLNLDLKTEDSIENQFYYNFQMTLLNASTATNLRDEIAKATIYQHNDNDNENLKCSYEPSSNVIEIEKKLLDLQRELVQHENCNVIISRQNEEIELISQENISYKELIENFKLSQDDLKTQLALEHDKKCLLLEKCKNLEDHLRSNNNYVAEIQEKLAEYTNLEKKCKAYSQKIEELETDNSMKYVKIVNLTVEIEKLRQILVKTDQQHKEELSKKINQLAQEKKLHEEEKNQLLEKIKILNSEKVILQNEKEELLSKIIQLENQHRELQNEKDELRSEQEQVQVENLKCKSAKDYIELEVARIQNESESLKVERNLLKNKCNNLRIAKDELEYSMTSRLGSLQKKIENTEIANKNLLSEICLMRHEKEQLEISITEYKDECLFNLQLKNQLEELSSFLEKLQKEHELITTECDTLKIEIKNEKGKVVELTTSNEKLAKDIKTLENSNLELINANNSLETELLVSREKTDYYNKKYNELEKIRQNLICENSELLSKVEKNENGLKKMDIDNKQLGIDLVNVKLALNKAEETIEMYEKLNESLSSENHTLQNTRREFLEKSQTKDNTIHKLQEICQTHENKIKELEMNLQSCKKENEDLKNDLANTEQALYEIQEKMEETTNTQFEKENMQKHIDRLEGKLQEVTKYSKEQKQIEQKLKLNSENSVRTIASLESKLNEEVLSKTKVTENLKHANDENSSLAEAILKLQSRIAFLEKQNELLDKEKNNLKNLSEEHHHKLMTAIKSKSELMQRNKKLTEQNLQLSTKTDQLSTEIDRKSKQISEANQRVSELSDDLYNTEKKISENERYRLDILENESERNKAEIEKIQKGNDHLLLEKEIMTKKIKTLEQDNLELTQQLEDLMLEKNAWLSEKINTCNCIENIARSKPTTGFDRLVKKNMRLNDKIGTLEEQLIIHKKINDNKSEEIIIAKERESQLSKEVADVKEELDKAIKNNDTLITEVEALISKIDKLSRENEELKKMNNHQEKGNCGSLKRKHETLDCFEEKPKLFNEISEIHQESQGEIENHNSMAIYMDAIRDRLCEKRLRLYRATVTAINVWKSSLGTDFVSSSSKYGSQTEHLTHLLNGPLDEEILQVEDQVHVTTALLDKLTSIRNHETLRQNVIEPNLDLQDCIEQEISPNINTDVLENLGLAGNLVRVNNFSTIEMEEKFTALVLAYTIDKTSLPQRCNVQKVRLRERERALGEEISTLSIHLRKYANDVDVSLHLEQILKLCTQVSISAEQFGSLTQQEKLSRAVELMINYVARLRQNIDNLPNQYLSIKQPLDAICTKNEVPITNQHSEDHKEERDLPAKIEKRIWIKETYFIITLSIAVLAVVIFFNMFESCHTRFEYIPMTPPV
ncbi:hypothetical protein Trydic_g2078 [Trypoxylus dichotomus]